LIATGVAEPDIKITSEKLDDHTHCGVVALSDKICAPVPFTVIYLKTINEKEPKSATSNFYKQLVCLVYKLNRLSPSNDLMRCHALYLHWCTLWISTMHCASNNASLASTPPASLS
jgi:hypothetical protein